MVLTAHPSGNDANLPNYRTGIILPTPLGNSRENSKKSHAPAAGGVTSPERINRAGSLIRFEELLTVVNSLRSCFSLSGSSLTLFKLPALISLN